jgi:glycosyltransferase involved in cell wall biosynthesis
MNILITVGIFPPDIGGPASFVPKIAKHLINMDNKVKIICLADEENLLLEDELDVLRIRRSTYLPIRWFKTISLIIKHGRESDILFVNGLGVEAAIANLYLRKKIIRKIVGDPVWERFYNKKRTSETFDDFQNLKHNLNVRIQKLIRNWSISSSEVVITPSDHLKEFINRTNPKTEVLKINNGIEITEFKRSKTPLHEFNILINSRLVVQKNIHLVIEAMDSIKNLDINLKIIGEGGEFASLEELITNLKIQNRVKMIGKVENNLISEYLKTSNLFIQASDYEGLPHSILEAINYEVPILSTEVGGCKDLLDNGDRGFIISSPQNKQQIAEKIDYIYENYDTALTKAVAAKKYIKNKYNFSTQAKKYTEVFEKIMKE